MSEEQKKTAREIIEILEKLNLTDKEVLAAAINDLKKKYGLEIEYPTLRKFIEEHECGAYHTFKFFTDGHDFKCCNISDFRRYYNENLLDQYVVVDFEHKVFNNSCDQYDDEYNLRIKKRGN